MGLDIHCEKMTTTNIALNITEQECDQETPWEVICSQKWGQQDSSSIAEGKWRSRLETEQAVGVGRHNTPLPSPPSWGTEAPRAAEPTAPAHRNVAVGSHAQYVPMLTAAAA